MLLVFGASSFCARKVAEALHWDQYGASKQTTSRSSLSCFTTNAMKYKLEYSLRKTGKILNFEVSEGLAWGFETWRYCNTVKYRDEKQHSFFQYMPPSASENERGGKTLESSWDRRPLNITLGSRQHGEKPQMVTHSVIIHVQGSLTSLNRRELVSSDRTSTTANYHALACQWLRAVAPVSGTLYWDR